MPTEQIRPILIIALCLVIVMMWQAWQQDYGPKRTVAPGSEPPGATDTARPGAATAPSVADVPDVASSVPPAAASTGTPTPGGQPFVSTAPSVIVVTDVLEARIALAGGTLAEVKLPRYPVSLQEPDEPFVLMSERVGNEFTAQSGLIGAADAPNHHAAYTASRERYVLDEGESRLEVALVWRGETATVTKIFRFQRDSYVVEVVHRVENHGASPWRGRMYGQFRRRAPNESRGLGTIYTYTGAVLSSPEKPYEKVDFSDLESEDIARSIANGWVAMIQHYFAGAWIPGRDEDADYYSKSLGDGEFVMGVVAPTVEVAPGRASDAALRVFIGPKIQKRLEAAAPGLARTVDYGWLFFIAEPLYVLLQFIQGVVTNWGWSIILLTVLVKLVFFPLSNASYKSMARMRKLQPKVAALKERFGGDRQKMNQSMMELYKKEKINPLGGCLPIVVQIPVFISLYWVLLESVELRQAPFMFWLKDLATHDPYYVLPLLMGASMFVQQRLSPAPPDPIQAKVMMAMPIVFTFFFLFFPSGLVLYWLVNNLLSIAQQWAITRRIEAAK